MSGIPADKLIFVLFELILALEERPLLVLREDHVLLGLLLLHLGDILLCFDETVISIAVPIFESHDFLTLFGKKGLESINQLQI